MKRIIAYLCLFIFTLQVLPVREIGKLLCKGQNTEEVHNVDDCGIVKEKKDDIFHYTQATYDLASELSFTKKQSVSFTQTVHLPDGHVADIPTPPPNHC